jgi:toxin ParE1/3/4
MPGWPRAALEILEAASLELSDSADWYETRSAGLGRRFLAEVRAAFDLIEERPQAGSPWLLQGIPSGVRHIPLNTFSYSVVYVLEPRRVVVAVANDSQKPTYWIDRLDTFDG